MDADWTIDPRFPRFEEGQTTLNVTWSARDDDLTEGVELAVLGLHGGMGPGQMKTLLVIIEDAGTAQSHFSEWAGQQLAQFPTTTRAPTSDPDGDGLPNWIEFIWRTDPARIDRVTPPTQTFSPWGEWLVNVTLRGDPAIVVVAGFADNVMWDSPVFDAGTWQTNADGSRTGTFRHYNFGAQVGFVRFRCEWLGGP